MTKLHLSKELEKLLIDEQYCLKICEQFRKSPLKKVSPLFDLAIVFVQNHNLTRFAYPWILYEKGWMFFELTNFLEATEHFERAFFIFNKEDNVAGKLACYSAFISGYSVQQKTSLAIERALEGINFAQITNNHDKLYLIKGNLAALYMEIGEYSKAIVILEEIEQTPYIIPGHLQAIFSLNQAECYTNFDQLEKALMYIEKAQELVVRYAPKMIPNILKEKAHILAKMSQFEEADALFEQSISSALQDNATLYAQDAYIYWAELDLSLNRYPQALAKLKEVEKQIEFSNSLRNMSRVYRLISKTYKKTKDLENAYMYLFKHCEIEKQLQEIRNTNAMDVLDEKRKDEEVKKYKQLYLQTESLYSAGQRILTHLESSNILNTIVKEIQLIVQTDIIHVALLNWKKNQLEDIFSNQKGKRILVDPIPISRFELLSYSITNKQALLIKNLTKEYVNYFDNIEAYKSFSTQYKNSGIEKTPKSFIIVPLLKKNTVLGIITVQSFKSNAFSLVDVSALKNLSNYIVIALENSKIYTELIFTSRYDSLTKLLNRRELFNKVRKLFKNNGDSKENQKFGLVMIDVDSFKLINDTYGHQEGDKILKKIAYTIKKALEIHDIVGRYGGEEFLAVFTKSNFDACKKKAEKIKTNVEQLHPKTSQGISIPVTVSIGGAFINTNDFNLEQTITLADKELYKVKRAGKNKVRFRNMVQSS